MEEFAETEVVAPHSKLFRVGEPVQVLGRFETTVPPTISDDGFFRKEKVRIVKEEWLYAE